MTLAFLETNMDDVISSGLARLNSVSFEMTDRTLKDALRISTNNSERMMLMRKLQDVGVSFIIHADAKAGYNLRNDVISTFVTETDEFTNNYLSLVEGLEYAEIIFDSTTDTPSLTPSYDPTISLEPTNSPRHGSSNTQSYSEKNVPVATAAAASSTAGAVAAAGSNVPNSGAAGTGSTGATADCDMKSGETMGNSQREAATTSFDAQGGENNGGDSRAREVLDAEMPSDDVASEASSAQQDTSTSDAQDDFFAGDY